MSDGFNFTPLMLPVATRLWGNPKPGATKTEVRFGDGRTVNPIKGSWWDHADEKGGGVLSLIERELGIKGRDAIDWLRREVGADIPDDRPAGNHQAPRRDARPAPQPARREAPPAERKAAPEIDLSKPTRTYDYRDADGALVMQVCRYEFDVDGKRDKTFRQRRPDPSARGGWSWKMDGVKFVPYRLAEIREAIDAGSVVFFVEGEKVADAFADRLGVPTTTNPMGAGKWFPDLTDHFAGADVVIIPDRDRQARKSDGSLKFHPDGRPVFVGQDHAVAVATQIAPVAKRVRILELPGLPDKGDGFEWIEAGGTTDDLFDLLPKARPWDAYRPPLAEGPNPDAPPPADDDPWSNADVDHVPDPDVPAGPFRSKFHAVTWADLDVPGPEHEWLVKNVLTRNEVSMLVGPSRSGKSFLAVDLAMSICRGIDFHGHKSRRGGVVYQAGEGGRGIKKRLRAYRQHFALNASDPLPFTLLPSPVDLYASEDQTNDLIAEIRHWASTFAIPLELVVIDTLSAATPGADENSSKDVGPVLARCARIARECNCSVMLVHHMNAAGNKPRGHTSILANLDSVISCVQSDHLKDADDRPIRIAKTEKQKDGADGVSWRFVLRSVELGRDEDNQPITSCVVETPNAGKMAGIPTTGEAKGLKLTAQADVFLKAVHRAIDEFGITPPPALQLPRHMKVVEWKNIRAIFAKLGFQDEPDAEKRADAIRQAAKRHGEILLSKNVIMKEGDYVWLTGLKVRGFSVNTGKGKAADAPPADEPTDGGRIDDFVGEF